MTAILYDDGRFTASDRVRIALGLERTDDRLVDVELLAGEQRFGAHLARQPMGRAPALKIDGLRLIRSPAILDDLEETRPAPPIPPGDPAERARAAATRPAG